MNFRPRLPDHLAGIARACRGGPHVAQPPVEGAEGLAQPVDDLDVAPLGRAAQRVAFDLVDAQLATEALRDVLDELGQDLARVLVLGARHKGRVAGDVRHDQETVDRWHRTIIG